MTWGTLRRLAAQTLIKIMMIIAMMISFIVMMVVARRLMVMAMIIPRVLAAYGTVLRP